MNVGEDTARGNGDATQQFIQFLIILDRQCNVARDDARFLIISRSVSCQFQNLCAEVLENGSQVHWSTGTHACGVLAIAQIATDATHGELKSSFCAGGRGLFLAASALSFSFARHDVVDDVFFIEIDDDERDEA
jgi:hypothetical protein